MAEVVLTDSARGDLIHLWEYVAADNPSAADALYDEITAKIALLRRFPALGHTRRDLPPEYRCLTSGHHLICYRMEGKTVVVVRIVEGSLNLLDLEL